jgi:HK97 family phage major capsid protein
MAMAFKIEEFKHNGKQVYGSDFNSSVKGIDVDARTITLVASDESMDRDGDVISLDGWDFQNYLKNPVFLWAHNYDSVPLARCTEIKRTNNQLVLKHQFPPVGLNPFADMIFNLYQQKIINAGSVGFLPHKFEPIKPNDERQRLLSGKRFLKQELLEHSGCAVPANPNAIQNALKQIDVSGRKRDVLAEILLGKSNLSAEFCNEEDVRSELRNIPKTKIVDLRHCDFNLNYKGVSMNELQKIRQKLLEKLVNAEGDEADALKQEIRDIDNKLQRSFPLPGAKVEDRPKPNRLYFTDREGKRHPAISVKENLSDLDGSFNDEISAGNVIRAHILGDLSGLNEAELKAQGEGIGSAGGWIVPTTVSNRIIDLARSKQVVMRAGAYTMQMPTPEMILVKVTSDPTAYWRKESAAITESEGAIEPIKLKAMTLGCLIRVSLELLEDASNASNVLEGMMSSAIALELDRIGLYGSGSGEPRGIDACTGINEISMGANGAAPSDYDEFSEAVQKVAEANGEASAVIMAPRTYYTLDRLKEATTNAPLKPPASYEDLEKFVTNQVGITDTKGTATTCSKAFIGDFKNVCYGMRKQLTIETSRSGGGSSGNDAFAQMEVLIRAYLRCDLAILREDHFTRIEGIKAS